MSEYRQLTMKADLRQPLPDVGELPFRTELHTADERARAAWNWIIKASFNEKQDYSLIEDDPACAPERVFFLRHVRSDVATAAARLTPDGKGWVHMVGTHPSSVGMGFSRYVVRAAMQSLKDLGVEECYLRTDDFRLPAIVTYRLLGFVPFYEPDDIEMKNRWDAIYKTLAAYKKPVREDIPLWTKESDPFAGQCGDQGIPFLRPFPVEGARGAMIVCPGGGYTHLAPHEADPIARMINLAGVSAYTLYYRVKPFPNLETPLSEVKRAIRLVRSMGYEKVAVMGFSAGGHLSGMAATLYDAGDPENPDPVERLSSRPDAFAPCYGATSLLRFGMNAWPGMLIGKEHPTKEELAHYSAEVNVTPDTPPCFMWHTADDPVVPVECALDLALALTAKGVRHEMHIYPHGEHGLGLAGDREDVGTWAPMLNKWLLSMGYGKADKEEV